MIGTSPTIPSPASSLGNTPIRIRIHFQTAHTVSSDVELEGVSFCKKFFYILIFSVPWESRTIFCIKKTYPLLNYFLRFPGQNFLLSGTLVTNCIRFTVSFCFILCYSQPAKGKKASLADRGRKAFIEKTKEAVKLNCVAIIDSTNKSLSNLESKAMLCENT